MQTIMRRALQLFPLIIGLILFCHGCTTAGNFDFDIETRLKSQLDLTQDTWMESDAELLKLETLHFGSFTRDNSNELLAIFRATSSPHVAGLERTIIAVYNKSTLKILTQKTFAADRVSLYFFTNESNRRLILYLGAATSQGIASYYLELLRIEDSQWTSLPVWNKPLEDSYGYALSGDKDLLIFDKQYFDVQYNGYKPPPPEIIALLKWDKAAEIFAPAELFHED